MVAALLCVLLGSIDLTVIATILPDMIGDLGVNTADIDRYIWAVNAYLIAYVVAIPLAGRVSDIVGRPQTFIGCLMIFLIGSIACATSDTLVDLVIGRGIQGFGGGGLLPVALALAGDTLGRRGQLAGIGFVSAVETLGWIVGPIYGAAVSGLAGFAGEPWRWVFWLNVPVLALLVLFLRQLPSTEARVSRRGLDRLDLPGAALLATALTSLNLALASGGELGAASESGLRAMGGTENPLAAYAPWLLAMAAVSSALLITWELRARNPLLPIALYRRRAFVATIAANLCIGAVLMVCMVNVPVVVALVAEPNRISTLSALMLAPFTIAVAIGSVSAGTTALRFGTRRMLIAAVVMAAVGCLLVASLVGDPIWPMAPGLILGGFGIGLLLPALGTLPIRLADRTDRGAAASSALMFRLLGMTVGVSLLTALGVRRLQVLTDRLDPIVRESGESTALFLVRQREYILEVAIPLSIQVIQETFVAAAVIALVAAMPIRRLSHHLTADKSAPSELDGTPTS